MAAAAISNVDGLRGIADDALTNCTALTGLVFSDAAVIHYIGDRALKQATEPQTLILPPDLGDTPTTEAVAAVVAAAADTQVAANVDATNYNDFREWAGTVKTKGGSAAGTQGVMDAPNAWLSFALGSETLIDAVPTNGQMRIDGFEPAAKAGTFNFTVSIDDIAVGTTASKENLKKVFGIEGGATLESGGMSASNVDITFGTPVDGKVRFTAGPKDADAKTFFMKVKLTP